MHRVLEFRCGSQGLFASGSTDDPDAFNCDTLKLPFACETVSFGEGTSAALHGKCPSLPVQPRWTALRCGAGFFWHQLHSHSTSTFGATATAPQQMQQRTPVWDMGTGTAASPPDLNW